MNYRNAILKPGMLVSAGMLLLAASGYQAALAQAIITHTNSDVILGVDAEGQLNITGGPPSAENAGGFTGLAYDFDGAGNPGALMGYQDATAPGCICEGWGVSASGAHLTDPTGVSGYANNSVDGVINLTLDSFASTASTATSMVYLTSDEGIMVTQAYSPAAGLAGGAGALFRDDVTITNTTGDTIDDVRYVRVMDWDVPPTEFDEFVTIQGTATTTLLERSHDNGFSTANPLLVTNPDCFGCDPATLDVDFVDNGPDDHGAYFLFNFGSLEDGESATFSIFYGAGENEAAANLLVATEGLELFSYGQSSGVSPTDSSFPTYIFGFSGVGGDPVLPPPPPPGVPEPGTLLLLGAGLLGLGAVRRRRSV